MQNITSSTLHSLSQVLCASTHRLEFSLLGQNPSCLTLDAATLAHKEISGNPEIESMKKYARIHRVGRIVPTFILYTSYPPKAVVEFHALLHFLRESPTDLTLFLCRLFKFEEPCVEFRRQSSDYHAQISWIVRCAQTRLAAIPRIKTSSILLLNKVYPQNPFGNQSGVLGICFEQSK